MGHIEVAAHDDGFLLVEFHQIATEGVLPRHAVVQTLEAVLAVGCVTGHEVETGHLEGDDTALMVMLLDADAIGHAHRFVPAVDGRARVPLLLGIVPIGAVTVKLQVQLSLLHLGLLQAEEIGVQFLEDVGKALAGHCTQAVHIPRDEFHCNFLI